MDKYIKINNIDNVAVALCDLYKGEVYAGVVLQSNIAKGHKFALVAIKKGENVIKYGNPIGYATADIAEGSHVHVHNVKTNLSDALEYTYTRDAREVAVSEPLRTVKVFERMFGKVGIRNELWVIPTVGCVNSQARTIVEVFNKRHAGNLGNIDGVFAFTHPYGCSQVGDDHARTKKLLQQMAKHPNAGGVLVLGLGCENNQMAPFIETLGQYDTRRTRFLIAQDVEDEISEGVKLLEQLFDVAKNDVRVEKDISCLKVGLKCGGSDGLSGITANPLLGRFSDYIASVGGTTVLTEVPEMFGAETLLMARAKNSEVFGEIVNLVNDFKDYYIKNGQPVYENPSPGNKAGGITTLEDKSLGCTQKSGCSDVVGVVTDGGQLTHSGLNLLNGPGNDMVAVTNLGLAGCHLVLFTTGRGTPFGGFVPTVKVATNSELAAKKSNWIDFDAGTIVTGETFDAALSRFIDYVADVASGQETKNEMYNSRDIALFKTGVTL
jgi:altronate hydrolase